MPVQRSDPYRSYNFRVAIGARARASEGFSEVRLPTLVVNPEGADAAVASLSEEAASHLLLRRGFNGATDLQEWWRQERGPKRSRGRAVTVELADETFQPVATWRFLGCRPVALHYSPLNALESSVVTETIVLAFDDVDLV
jgi:phage tail-like protein